MPEVLPPLSVYVHIPWCVRKCPYCDFNSHVASAGLPENEYVDALRHDLAMEAQGAARRPAASVFFGGGTPSLFSGAAIGRILDAINADIGLAANAEITLEANPGAVEHGAFGDYLAAGVNRLSIGVQSFDAGQLAALGRIHTADEAQSAFRAARRAGFDNINLDLMHGLPGQDVHGARSDLQCALALEPEHLSWYQLTIEPNTAFWSARPELPDENRLADIGEEGERVLGEAGLRRYEISAWSLPGRDCAHNRNYWEFGDYIGIGAGAHGKLSSARAIQRRWKTRVPSDYLSRAEYGGDPLAGSRTVNAQELPGEFMLNALRLIEGVPAELFAARTGLDPAVVSTTLESLSQRGLLDLTDDRWRATGLGLRFLDTMLAEF